MNILLPTDFSDNAMHAAKYAIKVFGKEANYTILHTIHVSHAGATVLVSLNDEMKELADQEMNEFIAILMKEFPGYDIDPLIEFGHLGEKSEEIADKEKTDLIVVGTKGASGIQEKLIGSNAVSIINSVDTPTLVVPEKAAFKVPDDIVFATDFENDPSKGNITKLAEICKHLKCKLSLLHVSTSEESEEDLTGPIPELEVLQDIDFSMHYVFAEDVEKSILDFAHDNDMDIIATIPHHEKFFQRLFHNSVSRKLSFHSDVPLIVLKSEE